MDNLEPQRGVILRKTEEAGVLLQKDDLLKRFARALNGNIDSPAIFGGDYIKLPDGRRYNPRGVDLERWQDSGEFTRRQASYMVGRVTIRPLLHTTRAQNKLGANDCQPLVNLLAEAGWIVPGGQSPELVRNNDGTLTIVVPWPEDIQTAVGKRGVSLDDLDGLAPANHRGRLVAAADTTGNLLTFRFGVTKNDPSTLYHLLISGGTGYGKSWFELSLLAQLTQMQNVVYDGGDSRVEAGPGCGIAVVDMKGGAGVSFLDNFPNQIGPVVRGDYDGARRVLAWFVQEIYQRKRRMEQAGARVCAERPLFLFLSEFTKLTGDRGIGIADPASIFMLGILAREGRELGAHIIADTQHVRGSLFGDTTTRSQFDDAAVFRPQSAVDAAGVIPAALQAKPYLTLHKPGEFYAVFGGRAIRAYAVHASDERLRKLKDSAAPEMDEWPEFDASKLEGFEQPRDAGQPAKGYDAGEISEALLILKQPGDKKKALRQALGNIGNDRAAALLALARELDTELDARGYCAPRVG